MKQVVIFVVAAVLVVPATAAAQTRRRTPPRQPAAPAKAPPEVRAAAEKISAQAKHMTLFLFRYGSVVKGIETTDDKVTRRGAAAAELAERLKENKAAVVASIRNLQTGLRQMETEFQANPSLKHYYQRINGLSDDVSLAADAAAADNFDEAGTRLVEVVGVLMDALLPQP